MDPLKVAFELFVAFLIASVVLGCLKLAHVYTGWAWLDLSIAMTLLLGGGLAFVIWLFVYYMGKM